MFFCVTLHAGTIKYIVTLITKYDFIRNVVVSLIIAFYLPFTNLQYIFMTASRDGVTDLKHKPKVYIDHARPPCH